jgi:hypothetical protein
MVNRKNRSMGNNRLNLLIDDCSKSRTHPSGKKIPKTPTVETRRKVEINSHESIYFTTNLQGYIYFFVSKFFTEFGKILTFAGGQVEVKVNNVGALMVASRGAKLGGDLWLKKGVR